MRRAVKRENILTDGKYKTPPAHIEREAAAGAYHNNGDDEPHNCESPQDQSQHYANCVEHVSRMCYMRNRTSLDEQLLGDLSECDNAAIVSGTNFEVLDLRKSRESQRSDGQ